MIEIKNIIDTFFLFWDTHEGHATILVMMVLIFKLYINRTATSIDYKKMFVSIPSEITFLVTGFFISDMVTVVTDETIRQKNLTGILVALLVLVVQIAWEKDITDNLAGSLRFGVKLRILIMYISSIGLYIKALGEV